MREKDQPPLKKVRTLRHWKQRFKKDAAFIWRRPKIYQGKQYMPGDPLPQDLTKAITKLRRFWEGGVIELAQFEDPNVATGLVDNTVTKGVKVVEVKPSWYTVTRGNETFKIHGKRKLAVLLKQLGETTVADD